MEREERRRGGRGWLTPGAARIGARGLLDALSQEIPPGR